MVFKRYTTAPETRGGPEKRKEKRDMKNRLERVIVMTIVTCMLLAVGIVPAFSLTNGNTTPAEPTEETAETAEAEQPETEEPIEILPAPVQTPEPDTVPATVRKDDIRAIVGKFERGDIVDIVDEANDEYYVIQDVKGFFYYVDKRFVRTDEEPFGEEQPMYADSNTVLYETAYLEGEPITTLEKNAVVVQIDELNDIAYCYYQPDDTDEPPMYGYTEVKNLSKDKHSSWQAYYYGGGSSGGGGGYSDGEDIFLAYMPDPIKPVMASKIAYKDDNKDLKITGTKGEIFSDGVEIIAAFYNKGEVVNFIEKNNDEYWTILYEHKVCQIPAKSVRIDGEEEPWDVTDGYIGVDQTEIFDNPELEGKPIKKLVIRAKVRGLELDGDSLYILVTDNTISAYNMEGWINVENFTTERPASGGGWYGGSSGGGGGSSGGGGGSAPASTPEWSGDYF